MKKEPTLEIDKDGTKRYYLDGDLHREDGPAVEWCYGHKEWYREGKRHREDGPALEHSWGAKYWYRNGLLHREDGPAIDRANGDKFWYYQGRPLDCSSQEEFEKIMKLKAFW